jgi:hypothetical protein
MYIAINILHKYSTNFRLSTFHLDILLQFLLTFYNRKIMSLRYMAVNWDANVKKIKKYACLYSIGDIIGTYT